MLIKSLPFYWRVTKNINDKSIIPASLPFDVDEIREYSLLTQKRNSLILNTLRDIYCFNENVGYLQENNSIAKPYLTDFRNYLDEVISSNGLSSLLEIGTGGCSLISELHKSGFDVLGIDSSPLSADIGIKLGFPVITDFYPSIKLTSKHDLIYSVDVLEHIEDPVKFLQSFKKNLAPNGSIILNVPDCTDSISRGDISMFIHQHLNYFSLNSLPNIVSAAGFKVMDCRKSTYGGSIYLHAILEDSQELLSLPELNQESILDDFLDKVKVNLLNIDKLLKDFINRNESIGFYIPLRSFPYIRALGFSTNYRIFDDTPEWHGKYFDGYEIPVENMDDFISNPTDNLLIMSLSFGEIIRNKLLAKNNNAKYNIFTLDDILEY